jgi:hypothetical protein
MPDIVAAPPSAAPNQNATPTVDVAPAAVIPPKTIDNPDTILAKIKARVMEANKPVAEPPKTDPAKDIQPDAKAALAELGRAQAKVRQLTEQVKASEAISGDAAFAKELRELFAKDPVEAVVKLSGKDKTEVLADLVTRYYEQTGEGGDKPAGTEPKPVGIEKMLLDKLEAVTKKLEALETERTSASTATAEQKLEQEKFNVRAYLKTVADQHKDLFEISARAENIEEALDKAMSQGNLAKAQEQLGIPVGAKLTAEQAEAIAKEALSIAENEFQELGKRFSRAPEPVKRVSAYDRPLTRPGVVVKSTDKPEGGKETFQEMVARYKKKYPDFAG